MTVAEKIENAQRMVSALCTPRDVEGHVEWLMSIPANPSRDPDIVISEALSAAKEEIQRLTDWVNDLQSRMYINCVYCGYRYGPEAWVPATMADALKSHIETCPKHPMSRLRKQRDSLVAAVRNASTVLDKLSTDLQSEIWEER